MPVDSCLLCGDSFKSLHTRYTNAEARFFLLLKTLTIIYWPLEKKMAWPN